LIKSNTLFQNRNIKVCQKTHFCLKKKKDSKLYIQKIPAKNNFPSKPTGETKSPAARSNIKVYLALAFEWWKIFR